ncbi:MAG: hypothetical protein EA380_03000 [Phycisphaeraceae bacterium]|nr:MAG: hypothetical protein EA380_03000 [Phycisphaeraceae bacterium]
MLKRMLTGILAAVLMVAPMTAVTVGLSAPVRASESGDGEKDGEKKLDQVIFLDGRTVQGEIIEMDDSRVVMMVHFGNFAPVRTTYNRAEILEVKRDAIAVAGAAPARDQQTGRATRRGQPSGENRDVDPDAAKLYIVDFEGLFGVQVSETPLRQMFEDVDRTFNDLVEERLGPGRTRMVVDPTVRDKHIVVIRMNTGTDPRFGFQGIFRAGDLRPIFFENMRDKGRRVVFWIEEARDGAAFLPWLSQEVYFKRDGRMWFTSDLEDFATGDDMVDEKLIGANLAVARGYGIEGGYGENAGLIIDAMARSSNWLIFRMEGGRPVLRNQQPTPQMLEQGWMILSDSGKGEFEDKNPMRDFNDRLLLDADRAYMLNVSKGQADSVEDLAFELGIQRNYAVMEHRGTRIFKDWADQFENAMSQINPRDGSIWREVARIQVQGDYRERTRARGRIKNLYLQVRSQYTRFAEILDPDGGTRAQIDVLIDRIDREQQLDRAAQRGV